MAQKQILTPALWRIATPVEAGAIYPISFPLTVDEQRVADAVSGVLNEARATF